MGPTRSLKPEPPDADPHVRWCGSREGKPPGDPIRSFFYPQFLKDCFMFYNVPVTGSQIRPLIRRRLQGFFGALMIGASNGSFDVHSPAQMRYDGIVVVNLGRGSLSDDFPCPLQISVDLIDIHRRCSDIMSERKADR